MTPRPPASISILFWNILHGGGTRSQDILLELLHLAPDFIALSEFRWTKGGQLAAALEAHGWTHRARTPDPIDIGRRPGRGRNGLFIASRLPLEAITTHGPGLIAVNVGGIPTGVRIVTAHVPCVASDRSNQARRAAACRCLLEEARTGRDRSVLIIGDLNSARCPRDGAGPFARGGHLLGSLESLGYADVFASRSHERTWSSPTGPALRIDHAFVSRPLASRVRGRYVHGPREQGLSDHSAILAEWCPAAGHLSNVRRVGPAIQTPGICPGSGLGIDTADRSLSLRAQKPAEKQGLLSLPRR